MSDDLAKAEKYYRIGREPIDTTIENELIGSSMIVHGGRAINAQLPDWLDKATEDWDVLSQTPEKTAEELEKLLDKRYGGDFFKVIPAKHEGTFRIVNNVTLKGVADISLLEKKIDYVTEDGINYATLEHHAKRIKVTLADPTKKFRWKKDRETLQRIRIYQRLRPKKKKEATLSLQVTGVEFRGFSDR